MIRSTAMQGAIRSLREAIAATGSVLVCGEPGSGRGLFARAVHEARQHGHDGSPEQLLLKSLQAPAHGPGFVIVDCATDDRLEHRLFGVELEADLPAPDTLGRISPDSALYESLTGSLVLRHLPELPRRTQLRLARVLRDGEIRIEFPDRPHTVAPLTCRALATSESRMLHDLVPELRRRVSHTLIEVPPLRHRREDIPSLARAIVAGACAADARPAKQLSRQATELLQALPWRGNVRELNGLLRTLVERVPDRLIRLTDVLEHVNLDGQPHAPTYSGTLKEARERFERDYVAAVLRQHRGRMAEAARALGLQRTNLYRKVKQLSLDRTDR
jgi:DNA-binding NtrC family response regulator